MLGLTSVKVFNCAYLLKSVAFGRYCLVFSLLFAIRIDSNGFVFTGGIDEFYNVGFGHWGHFQVGLVLDGQGLKTLAAILLDAGDRQKDARLFIFRIPPVQAANARPKLALVTRCSLASLAICFPLDYHKA